MARDTWCALLVPPVVTDLGVRAGGWCFEGSVRVGDRLTLVTAWRRRDHPTVRREVDVEVLEIVVFDRLIDEIEAGYKAELLLRGTGLELLAEGTALVGEDVAREIEEPS